MLRGPTARVRGPSTFGGLDSVSIHLLSLWLSTSRRLISMGGSYAMSFEFWRQLRANELLCARRFDLDEAPESVQRGDPVLSFSLRPFCRRQVRVEQSSSANREHGNWNPGHTIRDLILSGNWALFSRIIFGFVQILTTNRQIKKRECQCGHRDAVEQDRRVNWVCAVPAQGSVNLALEWTVTVSPAGAQVVGL